MMTVLALGLQATARDAIYLAAHPAKLVRSLIAMDVIVPLFAVAMVAWYPMHAAVKVALLTLSVSPVPPILPRKAVKAGGSEAYAIGLLAAASLLAIVFIPVAIDVLGLVFRVDAHMDASAVARLVVASVLAPLVVGIAVRHFAPRFAEAAAKPLNAVATIVLVASALAIIVAFWPAMMSLVGEGAIVALLGFVIVGLIAGHWLGGPEPDDRTVLAFSTAARHPGMAIAIAAANAPQQKLAAAAVVLYLLVSAVATIPYRVWRTRRVP